MGGPYTAARFAISLRERHPTDANRIVLTALAVIANGIFSLDPVAATVKRCGVVVADYVFDEVCNLHYVGENLEDTKAPYICADTASDALGKYASDYRT